MSDTITTSEQTLTVSGETRRHALAQAIANHVRQGWSVESQSEFQAVMVEHGTKTNHLLHLLLTLITLGLWVFVWIGLAIFRKREQHLVITIDEFGNTNIQR